MQLMRRNMTTFKIIPYEGSTPVVVGNLRTGEKEIQYGNPVEVRGNIAPPNSGSTSFTSSGYVNTRLFGETVDYDHIILLTNKMAKECGVKEGDLLYYTGKSTYMEIKRIAEDLNVTSIAAKRITVVPKAVEEAIAGDGT